MPNEFYINFDERGEKIRRHWIGVCCKAHSKLNLSFADVNNYKILFFYLEVKL